MSLPFGLYAPAAFAAAARVPYPVKVVTLVTHSSPGSGSDVFLRQLSKFLQRYIAANFIVENDDGGSGAKAVARVVSPELAARLESFAISPAAADPLSRSNFRRVAVAPYPNEQALLKLLES